ncbi:glutathione S-transferase [Serratia marcescens]|uniref:Glutathione S-transferase n=2 Tax=Serratia TaxID=613 RepID=A0A1G5LQW8_9GAMM|nr:MULTISPECIES: glutathione S-transferase [Serratia]PNU32691.1 glutathione S-transferase [Serratia marcescens]PNU49228.1 glutathione S-transferase [Serratia marcescens]CAI0744558.1 Glutathione S-transferase GST-4.5 [Serratia marcescens]CAI0818078.1 Glutathione S-transferase GST-4.5 [Serratia marcescens]SCZ15014.1 glutathione S-transferase [Serratia nematodiphila]
MKLYHSPGTCSLACWIALEWANVEHYEIIPVDPKSDEYKEINSLLTVPALDLGNGKIITQTHAILNFITDRYINIDSSAHDLYLNKVEFDEIMSFLSSEFHPILKAYFSPDTFNIFRNESSIHEITMSSFYKILFFMEHLDLVIGKNEYIFKNKRTVADAYAFVMLRWTDSFPKNWRNYSNLANFMKKMNRDPVIAKILALSKRLSKNMM